MRTKKTVIIRAVLTVLTIAAIGAIFYNSSLDAAQSSEQSGSLLEAFNAFLRSVGLNITITEHLIRKTAHFVEYFILGALLNCTVYSYAHRRSVMLCTAIPTGAVVAVCDELIQLTSAGRSCQVDDMLLDTAAVVCASLLIWLILYLHDRRRKV